MKNLTYTWILMNIWGLMAQRLRISAETDKPATNQQEGDTEPFFFFCVDPIWSRVDKGNMRVPKDFQSDPLKDLTFLRDQKKRFF